MEFLQERAPGTASGVHSQPPPELVGAEEDTTHSCLAQAGLGWAGEGQWGHCGFRRGGQTIRGLPVLSDSFCRRKAETSSKSWLHPQPHQEAPSRKPGICAQRCVCQRHPQPCTAAGESPVQLAGGATEAPRGPEPGCPGPLPLTPVLPRLQVACQNPCPGAHPLPLVLHLLSGRHRRRATVSPIAPGPGNPHSAPDQEPGSWDPLALWGEFSLSCVPLACSHSMLDGCRDKDVTAPIPTGKASAHLKLPSPGIRSAPQPSSPSGHICPSHLPPALTVKPDSLHPSFYP